MMKKLTATVWGALVLGFCFPTAYAGEEKTAASPATSQAVVASSETGDWSKEVKGLQGRLIVSNASTFNGTQLISVDLELRNVSDILNPLEIYYNNSNVKGEVTNNIGNQVPTAGLPVSIFLPSPLLARFALRQFAPLPHLGNGIRRS